MADEGDGIGSELTEFLQRKGDQVTLVPDDATDSLAQILPSLPASTLSGIVYLPSTVPEAREEDGEALTARITHTLARLITSLRALDDFAQGTRPRVFVATRKQQASRGVVPRSDEAPLWGAGLVAALEQPLAKCTMVDLTAVPLAREAEALGHELLRADEEREIALCGDERLVLRVRALPDHGTEPTTAMRELPDTHAAVLVNDVPGTLNELWYRPRPRT